MRSKRLFEAAVRDHYSKMLVSVTLCSEPLYSVSLCIVHGYARVHTSIYIYIYTYIHARLQTAYICVHVYIVMHIYIYNIYIYNVYNIYIYISNI